MTAVLAADIERATCGGRVHRAVGVDDKRATGVEYEWQSQPPRFTLVDPIEAAQRCFGSPRWAQCGLQTAPKFEFSLLHQAVEFEPSRSLAAFASLAQGIARCPSLWYSPSSVRPEAHHRVRVAYRLQTLYLRERGSSTVLCSHVDTAN